MSHGETVRLGLFPIPLTLFPFALSYSRDLPLCPIMRGGHWRGRRRGIGPPSASFESLMREQSHVGPVPHSGGSVVRRNPVPERRGACRGAGHDRTDLQVQAVAERRRG